MLAEYLQKNHASTQKKSDKEHILRTLYLSNVLGSALFAMVFILVVDSLFIFTVSLFVSAVYLLGYFLTKTITTKQSAIMFVLLFMLVQWIYNFLLLPIASLNFLFLMLAPGGLVFFYDTFSKLTRIFISVFCYLSLIIYLFIGPIVPTVNLVGIELRIVEIVVISIFFSSSLMLFDMYVSGLKDLEGKLYKMANIDELTGALNRRALFNFGQQILTTSSLKRQKNVVMILDLDHFKKANDEYGHVFGDKVLKQVGCLLKAQATSNILLSRYGGEEFVAVLSDTSIVDAVELAERWRQSIENLAFVPDASNKNRIPKSVHMTISIGLAKQKLRFESLDTIIDRADKALYQAKKLGRNRVVVCDDDIDGTRKVIERYVAKQASTVGTYDCSERSTKSAHTGRIQLTDCQEKLKLIDVSAPISHS